MQLEATATDADGLVGHVTAVLKVRDPADQAPPFVAFAPGLDVAPLTSVTDIRATIADSNLDLWKLERAPAGSAAFTTLASGNASVPGGVLAAFDPGAAANGFYRLRLTAQDISGRVSQTEVLVEVNTVTKTGQHLETQTDLTVQLGGVTVSLVRTYDSLSSNEAGTFGYGWRLANRDLDIETSVPATGREHLGVYGAFQTGSRVYLTLPDGRRVGFTFAPERHDLPGVTYYTPAFTADPGVDYQLTSASALLTLAANRYYDLHTARPYNPADSAFAGPAFTLAAPDGTVYSLDAAGEVQEQHAPGGERLVFSDSGITRSTGESIQFGHDSAGRLTAITAPDGTRVLYSYDADGNLVSARNAAAGTAARYGYAADGMRRRAPATPAPAGYGPDRRGRAGSSWKRGPGGSAHRRSTGPA